MIHFFIFFLSSATEPRMNFDNLKLAYLSFNSVIVFVFCRKIHMILLSLWTMPKSSWWWEYPKIWENVKMSEGQIIALVETLLTGTSWVLLQLVKYTCRAKSIKVAFAVCHWEFGFGHLAYGTHGNDLLEWPPSNSVSKSGQYRI